MTSSQNPATPDSTWIRLRSPKGRWVLTATVLGSAVTMLTGTVVNAALPDMGTALSASTRDLQWILNGYLLAVASLILIGGALGDRYGHRRMFVIGTIWFTVASILCAFAPDVKWLIAFRILQGVGAALLTPESLAIIESVFHPDDRGKAIGAWSALGGIAAAIGPVLGGWLIDISGWRSVFLLVVPLSVVVISIGLAFIPTAEAKKDEPLDFAGAGSIFLALGLITYALIQGPVAGLLDPVVMATLIAGLLALAAFIVIERKTSHPMVPLIMFRNPNFAAGNILTFVVYTALGGSFFLLIVFLQVGVGYSALQAGASLLPVTALMLMFSASAGQYAHDHGPRVPLTVGPLFIAGGLALMARISPGQPYWIATLPAVVVFGLGLAATVAPVTSTVLNAAKRGWEGAASGINNAVSRAAQLIAVAIFPAIAGLSGGTLGDQATLLEGFPRAVFAMAAIALLGSMVGWFLIPSQRKRTETVEQVTPCHHCAVDGSPVVTQRSSDT